MSGWRVPLRVARRDALRSRGRSALIVAMIAVPVLGLGMVDVLIRTGLVDAHERVSMELGSRADAWVEIGDRPGVPLKQAPDAQGWSSADDSAAASATPVPRSNDVPSAPKVATLGSLLPSGSHIATLEHLGVVVDTDAGTDDQASAVLADLSDPLVAGRFSWTGGTPSNAHEVLASRAFLQHEHVHVGSTVHITEPDSGSSGTFRIVGVLHDPDSPRATRLVAALPGSFGQLSQSSAQYLVSVPGGVPWSLVKALNAQGYIAFSRQVVAHPPAAAQVPYLVDRSGTPLSTQRLFGIVVVVLVVGLAVLEVCLLAGAAFAVGVRRQTRTVGLLMASGADRSGVRRVVLAQGVVLGFVAALVGIPVAVLLARVVLPVLEHYADQTLFGPFDLRPAELVAIGSIAVVAGLAAALIPARTASRLDPVRALAGRRGQTSSPHRWPLIGLAMAGLGAALSLVAAARVIALYDRASASTSGVYGAAALLLAGAVLVQVGLIIATPAIIGFAGRLAGRLPLAPRLALRDASRNRGRTAPAVGAVLAAVAVSSALLMNVASQDKHDRDGYHATLLSGQGQVRLLSFGVNGKSLTADPTVDVDSASAALRATLPIRSIERLQTLACTQLDACQRPSFDIPRVNECPERPTTDSTEAAAQARRLLKDWRCTRQGGSYASRFNGDPVGDVSTLEAITGTTSAAAKSVLDRGGVVVLDRTLIADGKATVDVYDDTGQVVKRVTLPAVYLPPGPTPEIEVLWSRAAAQQVGMRAVDDSLLLSFTRTPTHAELAAANKRVKALGVPDDVYVESGYHSNYGPGLIALVAGAALITLLATGVATGLAQADARPDHATLAAIGAAPRLRRWLAGAQSWTLALLGTGLGVIAGFVPAMALLWARPDYAVVVPWRMLVITVVVVPLLAGLGALLCTRSRLPLERRLT